MDVGIDLQPQIAQCMRRMVVVVNFLTTGEMLRFIVQLNIDDVVGALLPVVLPRFASASSIAVGGGQDFFQLTELVFLAIFSVLEGLGDGKGGSKYK